MFKLILEKIVRRDQIANICWIIEKTREFQKNIYFCFIDYAKDFACVDHNKVWKILKEMGMLDHLTCLLRNLYARQEATVRIGHGTTDWFQIGKEYASTAHAVGALPLPSHLTVWFMSTASSWKHLQLSS